MPPGPISAMSVDVEDYVHAWALSPVIQPGDWERWPSRVELSTRRVLDLLAAAKVKATCFVLGWVASRHPTLVKAIVAAGHELASHGYGHEKVSTQSPAAFRADVTRARALLEDIGGVRVQGYRAPSFSIGSAQWWAFSVLAETGHSYSSSLHPIRHDHYGLPSAPRTPFRPTESPLVEVPVATVELGWRVSCAGGGYFRLLPYACSRRLLARHVRHERLPATFYFHPWEIDLEQPRVRSLPLRSRLRHYVNLGRMESKLERLLRDFAWGPISSTLELNSCHLPRWEPTLPMRAAPQS
jgi:polysaccharide deacetylase family protein (PEP-CTERM system associated)